MMRKAGPSVLKKLRRLYREQWKLDWPHDNAFLSVLWFEARESRKTDAKKGPYLDWVYQDTLIEMRTNHNF